MLSSPAASPSTAGSEPQWRPGHMPRLSYRNAAPPDDTNPPTPTSPSGDKFNSFPDTTLPNASGSVPPSRAIKSRPTSQNTSMKSRSGTGAVARPSMMGASTMVTPSTKKRQSLFGGLFVKEPSSVALEQLAQTLIAQHGELSARAIPGVSCATMPRTVPKVNSKWDGRPGSTRLKASRGRDAFGTKSASSGSSARSRSAEPSERDYTSSRGTRATPWQSSSTSSVNPDSAASQWSEPQTPATDVDVYSSHAKDVLHANALGKMPRPQSGRPYSLRSSSGSSLQQITSFFPEQIPESPALPPNFRTKESPRTTIPVRVKPVGLIRSQPQISTAPESLVDGSLDNMSSQSATSSEASPSTPLSPYTPIRPLENALSADEERSLSSFAQSTPEEVILLSSGKNVLGPPAGAKRRVGPSPQAFLAGEARPLEIPDDSAQDPQGGHLPHDPVGSAPLVLSNSARVQKDLERRPDSSRARLGLRASKNVDTNAAPALSNLARVQQDLEKRPDSSRARLGLRASMLVDEDKLPWNLQENLTDGGIPVHYAAASNAKMAASPKSKPKGFGVFGRDKTQK